MSAGVAGAMPWAGGIPDVVDISRDHAPAGCVRIFGSDLAQHDYGYRYFQLQQMQAFGE
jgi:hypothetical protein